MPFSLPGRWCFFLCFLPLFCSGIAVILKRRQESTVSLNTLPWHTHTPKRLFTNPMHLNSVVGKGSFYFKFEYCACCLGSLGNFHFWSSLENTRRIKAEESRWEVRSGGGGRWQGLMPLEWMGRMGDRGAALGCVMRPNTDVLAGHRRGGGQVCRQQARGPVLLGRIQSDRWYWHSQCHHRKESKFWSPVQCTDTEVWITCCILEGL